MEGGMAPCIPSFGANVGDRLHTFLAVLPQKEEMLQFRKCLGSTAAGLEALEKRIIEPTETFKIRSFYFLVIGALTKVPLRAILILWNVTSIPLQCFLRNIAECGVPLASTVVS
jgi:hypothetical protein